MTNSSEILIVGDLFALAVVTVFGFATHGETGLLFLPRLAATFIPLVIAWFLLAPWFGLFRAEISRDAPQLWRPALAMLFACPLATVLRGLILNAPIVPIFAVVLSVTSALGMIAWRGLFCFVSSKTIGKRR